MRRFLQSPSSPRLPQRKLPHKEQKAKKEQDAEDIEKRAVLQHQPVKELGIAHGSNHIFRVNVHEPQHSSDEKHGKNNMTGIAA